jgi:hypothetical protein
LSRPRKRNRLEVMHDKLVLSRYIESTKKRYRNKNELCTRLARIFKLERSYVWYIISILKWERPELFPANKKHRTQHVEKQKRTSSGFRRLSHRDKGLIAFKPKTKVVHVPRYAKSDGVAKKEFSLKDAKPLDGAGSVWKKGKIEPVEQKDYRGSFQDKD